MPLGLRAIPFLLLFAAHSTAGQNIQNHSEARPPADLVILNGAVWTVDAAKPRAQAVAVVGERIAAVGTNEEIRQWAGPKTRTIDARGGSVLPGFIDSHVHFASGGFELSQVQLRDAATPEEFARRVGEYAKKLPKGEWIQGGTWDHELWGGDPLPHRKWIDAATPDHPVMVSRYDGHMALANSAALRLAGVTRDTPTPAGGEIVKDANGEPTGLLKDAAMELVFRVVPRASEEQLTRAVKAALGEAARFGVTGIHDMSSGDAAAEFRVYQKLAARGPVASGHGPEVSGHGELTTRILAVTPIELWEAPARTGITAGFGNAWLRTGALKGYADGSLGSTTALFFEPYDDAPNTSGLPAAMMFPEGNMLKMALGADAAGLQLCIHAIGDKANRGILEIYEQVRKRNGERPRRWRIEHAQHIHPDDFATFTRLGVIASMQPYHAIDDGRWAAKRIGHERGKGTYAFRTFLDRGVRLAFGSDWTVAPLNPMEGIYAAVTRRTLDGKNPGGWYPEQKITLAEAIEAYTMGSAYAEGAEEWKGSLTPGKLADIVVLDANLFKVAPEKIREVRVLQTVVGGQVVYESEEKSKRR
ncbi:MAG: amidohydrolase [Candidatus Acidiferrales bacterium]